MKARILVADDNPDNLYLLETLLKAHGCSVVTAVDGDDALAKLQEGGFDMILSDVLMPGMDGFQLCRECKRDDKLRTIPFVFCTATYTDEQDADLARTIGADQYIRKPVEADKLLALLQDVLAHKHPTHTSPAPSGSSGPEDKTQVLRLYNERLVKKLESKMLDLEASQRRYLSLWQNVSDLVLSLDEDYRVLEINHSNAILGYNREEVIGKHLSELLTPACAQQLADHTRKAGPGTSSRNIYEAEFTTKKGGMVAVELSIATIYADGEFVGNYGIARDITARKKAEQALRESASELRKQKKALEQKNTALREVLTQIESEKLELRQRIGTNVDKLIAPTLRKLSTNASVQQRQQIVLIERNLQDLTSEFATRIGSNAVSLTPMQTEICNMIKSRMATKEIAEALGISTRTVETHRNRIRKKLGISHKDVNLATYLSALG